MRKQFIFISTCLIATLSILFYFQNPLFIVLSCVLIPLLIIGFYDFFQKKHAVRRNFPIIGHLRYILESIRPEIAQYFVETDTSGVPLNREQRSLVYTRSKKVRDTIPFGTKKNVYEVGYEWVNHSMRPVHIEPQDFRVIIGGKDCKKPYSASRFNISAMSFGSLSKNAVLALSQGAKIGHFAHNTGEGGISPYHLEGGGDLIWQIGTGYFGCRTKDGKFNPESFKERASLENVKMIEIKMSQGAKPGHGGILPASKVTEEIALIRDVERGKDVLSPPGHSSFSTPKELLLFIKELRDLSDGKPIGFKICLGRKVEFVAICKAMIELNIYPDFISVDGSEGGTGAAPVEFTNHIGIPLFEALMFVHNCLVGFNLRKEIKIIASGKTISGFDLVQRFAIGADLCNAARSFMLSLGCIQALKCNTNECPVGVATQDKYLTKGLVVSDKKQRVANYHNETINSVCEIMGAMGIEEPERLYPGHIMIRVSETESKNYSEIYEFLDEGALLKEELPASFKKVVSYADANKFY
jgi:glutamate synthase domain-containing protein 2